VRHRAPPEFGSAYRSLPSLHSRLSRAHAFSPLSPPQPRHRDSPRRRIVALHRRSRLWLTSSNQLGGRQPPRGLCHPRCSPRAPSALSITSPSLQGAFRLSCWFNAGLTPTNSRAEQLRIGEVERTRSDRPSSGGHCPAYRGPDSRPLRDRRSSDWHAETQRRRVAEADTLTEACHPRRAPSLLALLLLRCSAPLRANPSGA